MGVDTARPRLSWVLGFSRWGQKQLVYQVLVARSEDDLRTEEKGFQSPNMSSFNHYSLGSVGEWLYHHEAGINQEPRISGYKHIVIHPHPGGGLTSARAEYNSVRGRIASEWEVVDGTFQLMVTILANTTATVHVQVRCGGAIIESNHPIEQAESVELLRFEDGETVVTVGSGRHEFVGSVG